MYLSLHVKLLGMESVVKFQLKMKYALDIDNTEVKTCTMLFYYHKMWINAQFYAVLMIQCRVLYIM